MRQPAHSTHLCRRDAGVSPAPPLVRADTHGRRWIHFAGQTFLIYQIYYDDEAVRHLDPVYTPYRNARPSRFFEAAAISRLLGDGAHRGADFFGVFSWKFAAKIPLRSVEILARMRRDHFAADVYTFFGRVGRGPVWRLAERKHPGILAAADALLHRIGCNVDVATLDAPIVYQNHFLARSAVYERFWKGLLRPALRAMEDASDAHLQGLLQRDAHYHDSRLSLPRLRALFGRPYFGLHPFVCERLFSTWLALNPSVRVRHIWRGRFVEADNVRHEPEMRGKAARA
ncbi:MAG: hypothetical protein U0587_03520 [Candidatus Binatia bacterium]